eukprot:TRINITY_DN8778_c0_g5_i1.p1 TRINITY_DN8778_c0_g5~~TRINITY_DN8778_c0_g5_i1.p1  ORF type:complete len:500 (+),score=88.43 TRINITY_DN8778_c0_g5_i1:148-1647(+)
MDTWLPSWMGKVNDTYNMLWKMVIRPPRDLYTPDELGPAKFRLGRTVYERKDLQLQSERGSLECSHFIPAKSSQTRRPCVVYLHGNCSSRLEAFDALPVLLPRDLTVFCMDLSGSGRSEGEYISLGHYEERDLAVVLQYLRSTGTVSGIGLWGRSMGATTSILRAGQDHGLAACVLDSPFRDLREVAEEFVNRGRIAVPQFMLNMAFDMMRQEVVTRAGFDPVDLVPAKSAPHCRCPALFGVAADDTFVLPHHTQDLHDAWAGERELRVFDGGHNGVRPSWFLEEAADFLAKKLRSQARRLDERHVAAAAAEVVAEIRARAAVEEADASGGGYASREQRAAPAERVSLAAVSTPAQNRHRGDLEGSLELADEGNPWRVEQPGGPSDDDWRRPMTGSRGFISPVSATPGSPGGAGSDLRTPQKIGLTTKALTTPSHVRVSLSDGNSVQDNPGIGPVGADLEAQLRYLGFDTHKSRVAARECTNLESAAEWLVAQHATVAL